MTGVSEAENRDSLHWLMGRFTGYVGVVNYLGGKFTADARALTPALAEIASRGLPISTTARRRAASPPKSRRRSIWPRRRPTS